MHASELRELRAALAAKNNELAGKEVENRELKVKLEEALRNLAMSQEENAKLKLSRSTTTPPHENEDDGDRADDDGVRADGDEGS